MNNILKINFILILFSLLHITAAQEKQAEPQKAEKPEPIKIARIVSGKTVRMNYPNSVTTLLKELNLKTTTLFAEQPVILQSFETQEIFKYPFIFVNFADREDWTLSTTEKSNIKSYLERGGFIYIDAGINTEFLRKDRRHGQHHSFADWSITPVLKEQFQAIFHDKQFSPLKSSHDLFKCFYHGLPDPKELPDTVRNFVVNEKWPDGTYSAVGLKVNGRIAVLATPIISMGWGRNHLGQWQTEISFRIREGAEGLTESLETAAYSGAKFDAIRKDGRKDYIYCQQESKPAWAEEADGNWRVFRYYRSREISDYAHTFYTRLGINIILYAISN